jgi:hypothetical protein
VFIEERDAASSGLALFSWKNLILYMMIIAAGKAHRLDLIGNSMVAILFGAPHLPQPTGWWSSVKRDRYSSEPPHGAVLVVGI